MKFIRKTFIIILATAGIRIDKINDTRIDALIFIIMGYGANIFLSQYISLRLALIYFFTLFAARYIFLFGGFLKNGFSDKLIQKYGEKKAWNIYELLTSVMFFQRSLSFGLLAKATQWSFINMEGSPFAVLNIDELQIVKYGFMGLGFVFVVIGFWVNISATYVIGIDTYYYKDLFLKRSIVDFKVEGPYKYFSNPMYGIGQSSGYGAALMMGSIPGVLATFLNQIMMYIFYFVVEKPHIKAVYFKEQTIPVTQSQPLMLQHKTFPIMNVV